VDDGVETEMIALLPRVRRFAFSLTGSWPDADDLLQATCERAISRIGQWEPGTRLDSWMYRIAQNLHRNELRQQGRRNAHLRLAANDDVDTAAANSPIDRIELGEVGAMMQRLPSDQRTVLLLVAVEGVGYQDAADILGVSPGTVASRLSRARSALAVALNGETDV